MDGYSHGRVHSGENSDVRGKYSSIFSLVCMVGVACMDIVHVWYNSCVCHLTCINAFLSSNR